MPSRARIGARFAVRRIGLARFAVRSQGLKSLKTTFREASEPPMISGTESTSANRFHPNPYQYFFGFILWQIPMIVRPSGSRTAWRRAKSSYPFIVEVRTGSACASRWRRHLLKGDRPRRFDHVRRPRILTSAGKRFHPSPTKSKHVWHLWVFFNVSARLATYRNGGRVPSKGSCTGPVRGP